LFGVEVNIYTNPDSNLNLAIKAVPILRDSIDLGFETNYEDFR